MTLVFGQTLVHLLPEPANEILHGDSTTGNVIFYHVLIILMHLLLSQCLPAVSWCFSTQSTSTKLRAQCESSINMWCSHSKRRKVRHLQATRNLMRTVAKAKAAAMSLQCCAVFQLVQSICWWAISSPNSPSFASLSPHICISVFVSDVPESIQYISIYVLILLPTSFVVTAAGTLIKQV